MDVDVEPRAESKNNNLDLKVVFNRSLLYFVAGLIDFIKKWVQDMTCLQSYCMREDFNYYCIFV